MGWGGFGEPGLPQAEHRPKGGAQLKGGCYKLCRFCYQKAIKGRPSPFLFFIYGLKIIDELAPGATNHRLQGVQVGL